MNDFTKYSFSAKSFQSFSDSKPSQIQKSTNVGYSGTIVLTEYEKKLIFEEKKKAK